MFAWASMTVKKYFAQKGGEVMMGLNVRFVIVDVEKRRIVLMKII